MVQLKVKSNIPPQKKSVGAPRPPWDPISALHQIDHVEINHTRVRGGVVFYNVEVYVRHQVKGQPRVNQSVEAEPDYVVRRRFSDFDLLRRHVAQHARREIVGACRYCDRFRLFMLRCYKQPKAFVKLCTGVDTRKKLLERFLNRMVELAVTDERAALGAPRVCQCPGVRAIPTLIDQFMRNRHVVV
ncbi:hypothetical protein PHYPSEUDO_012083 [Phytophthora pseudosyringae]|uniref:PX domain-containing protein n=1 Tax=Phytophthora pseudosyringae TaxID=221518 RepID=A0A8T1VAM4_9STRA|nr:hypothetical protein PHYPSEUDO_012083 [Phytophthora pseudosyringae]